MHTTSSVSLEEFWVRVRRPGSHQRTCRMDGAPWETSEDPTAPGRPTLGTMVPAHLFLLIVLCESVFWSWKPSIGLTTTNMKATCDACYETSTGSCVVPSSSVCLKNLFRFPTQLTAYFHFTFETRQIVPVRIWTTCCVGRLLKVKIWICSFEADDLNPLCFLKTGFSLMSSVNNDNT